MKEVWNKGKTKENDSSVRKISETMRRKRIDNFAQWREENKKEYVSLNKDGDLAELVGVILGDGYIGEFPRTECLRIVGDATKPGFIHRSAWLIERVFNKKPHVSKRKGDNGVNITMYEKHISKRIGIPAGAQANRKIVVPLWILKNEEFIRRYLRGLYEAEGSYCVHEGTYTHKLIFSNANDSLLNIVERLVKKLGFHPHRSYRKIQVSRQREVEKLVELLQYRQY